MVQKPEINDDVLVRGQVVFFDDDGKVRVQFPGYHWPITIRPEAIAKVIKAKPKWDEAT